MTYLFKDHGLVSLSTGGGNAVVDAAVVTAAVSAYKPRGLHIASHSSANDIARGVEASDVPLDFVFLNTCLSGDTAHTLVASGRVKHVISWESVISDAGAALFAKLFYESLPGYGWDVEKAYARSVDALNTELTAVGDPSSRSVSTSRAVRVGIPLLVSAPNGNDCLLVAAPTTAAPPSAPTVATPATAVTPVAPVATAPDCPTCGDAPESGVCLKVETATGAYRRARCCDLRGSFATLCETMAADTSSSTTVAASQPSFEFVDEDGDRMVVSDDASLADALDTARNAPRKVLKLNLCHPVQPVVESPRDLPPFKGVVSLDIVVGGTTLRRAGSGVMINSNGVGVTNWHVVAPLLEDRDAAKAGDRPPTMRGVLGRVGAWDDRMTWTHAFEVVEVDQALDLAVFRVGVPLTVNVHKWGSVSGTVTVSPRDEPTPTVFDTVPVGASSDARPLDDLTVLGFPGIGGLSMTFNKTTHGGVAVSPTDGHRFIRFMGSLNSGGSGGAVVNTRGQLVGIAAHTPQLATSRPTRMTDEKGVVHNVRLDFDPHAQPVNHAIPIDTVVARFPAVFRGRGCKLV